MYPRIAILYEHEKLVNDNQCVGYKEHMADRHRMLFLSGAIVGDMENHNLIMALDSICHDPIKVVITSAGGDLDATFLFIDTMKLIQSPVITIGRYCASAACLILASGKERYLFPHARTMLHLATGQMGGDYKDFAIQHKLMESYQNKIVDILTEAGVKKTRDEILKDIDRDFWLDPQETIDYGLADNVLDRETWLGWVENKNIM